MSMMFRSLAVFLVQSLLFSTSAQAQAQAANSFGMSALMLPSSAETRMVSPENRTGEKGAAAKAIPDRSDREAWQKAPLDLGQGWKVSPFITIEPGATAKIMDVRGPGTIQHIWFAASNAEAESTILRMYWDGEEKPSVEAPLPNFFAVGHEMVAPVLSMPIVVAPHAGFNSYWPMPFGKSARITVTNTSSKKIDLFTYQITYSLGAIPKESAYFHAQHRTSRTSARDGVYTILEVCGSGRFVGTFLAWEQRSEGWFGEGEVKFFIDGDRDFPTIAGTGTEDYFGASYGFPQPYTSLFLGNVLDSRKDEFGPKYQLAKWSLYRWHIPDPIEFHEDLRVTVQMLGWNDDLTRYRKRTDDRISSVAFWYQEPDVYCNSH
jgi:D-arabinan exo alpha-(1,3)/(1,5)-arabinofuranosidase (non-reducing end)